FLPDVFQLGWHVSRRLRGVYAERLASRVWELLEQCGLGGQSAGQGQDRRRWAGIWGPTVLLIAALPAGLVRGDCFGALTRQADSDEPAASRATILVAAPLGGGRRRLVHIFLPWFDRPLRIQVGKQSDRGCQVSGGEGPQEPTNPGGAR